MDCRVYIANLGKYNEGELVGAWFTLPIDEDEIAEKVGLNDIYEEYAIHDYEAPFPVDEYTSVERLNEMYDMYEELSADFSDEAIETLLNEHFDSIDEFYENKDDIIFYSECNTMTDVAWEYIYQIGGIRQLSPETLMNYFDYESFGRDMEIEGTFLFTDNGAYQIY